ncbi:MAG: hypothetical protein KYX69_06360 [Sphingomonas sp.]|uniref:hypothetical protein n=1 Tax=Sphingomonas sp. TaxID=28214 RepID=UPI00260DF317|nr:hypothetical protein [Sphingomonas sp.]MDK2767326.1 hypothetical protein [Sphingomonas sp.]
MSKVSGIILTYSVAEPVIHGPDFPSYQINDWLGAKELQPLVLVDGAAADWHPGCCIAIGGYNHFDEAGFSTFIRSLPWAYPDDVVLVIHPDDGGARVIRPLLNDD